MKISICTIVFSFFVFGLINAQNVFQRTYGGTNVDGGYYIAPTHDGGYVITGYANSYTYGEQDVYLIKIDSKGDTLWTKTFGGPDYEVGASVQQTADKGYIITGWTYKWNAPIDIYLIKTDSNGNMIWNKTYGEMYDEYGSYTEQTTDGGYIITGATNSFSTGSYDTYVIKTDANGDTLWTKIYGGVSHDECSQIKQTKDGGFILVGRTRSFGVGNSDIYLIKIDSLGNSEWIKTYGGANSDIGYSLDIGSNGEYIITGWTFSHGAGECDVFLSVVDSMGNLLWTKTYGTANLDYGHSVQSTFDKGYIITGFTEIFGSNTSDMLLIKTDSSGNMEWSRIYGGPKYDFGDVVLQCPDSGYIILGNTFSFGALYPPYSVSDPYLVKTDKIGISECNNDTINMITSTATFSITSPSPPISSGGIVGSLNTYTGSGCIITDPCLFDGIKESEKKENTVSIYPNPSSGSFSFNLLAKGINYSQPCQIIILNSQGDLIFESTITNQLTVDISAKAKGLYFYRITFQSGEVDQGKLILY